jgi:hypothetical protein
MRLRACEWVKVSEGRQQLLVFMNGSNRANICSHRPSPNTHTRRPTTMQIDCLVAWDLKHLPHTFRGRARAVGVRLHSFAVRDITGRNVASKLYGENHIRYGDVS